MTDNSDMPDKIHTMFRDHKGDIDKRWFVRSFNNSTEYTRTALVDELIEACKPTNTISTMYFTHGLQRHRERIDAAIAAMQVKE